MTEKAEDQEPSIEEILSSIRQIISDDDEKSDESTAEKPAENRDDNSIQEQKQEPQPVQTNDPEPKKSDEEFLELTTDDIVDTDEPSSDPNQEDNEIIVNVEDDNGGIEMIDSDEDQDLYAETDATFDLPPEPQPSVPSPESTIDRKPTISVNDPEIDNILNQIRQGNSEESRNMDAKQQENANTMPSDILSTATQAATLGSLSKLTKKMPINNTRSFDGVTLEDIVRELLHPMLREWMDDNLPPMVERIVQKEMEKLARRAFDD